MSKHIMETEKMNASRKAYAALFREWHPTLFVALYLVFLFLATEAESTPLLDWIYYNKLQAGLGIILPGGATGFWRLIFFSASIFIGIFRPAPRWLMGLSMPILLLAGFTVWFWLETRAIPSTVMVNAIVTYFGVLGVVILTSVVVDYADENMALRDRIAQLERALTDGKHSTDQR